MLYEIRYYPTAERDAVMHGHGYFERIVEGPAYTHAKDGPRLPQKFTEDCAAYGHYNGAATFEVARFSPARIGYHNNDGAAAHILTRDPLPCST